MSRPYRDSGFLGAKRRKWLLWTPLIFVLTFILAGNVMSYYSYPGTQCSGCGTAIGRVVKVSSAGAGTNLYNVTLALSVANQVGISGSQRQNFAFHIQPPLNSTAFYGTYLYMAFFPFAGSSVFGPSTFTSEAVSPTASTPAMSYSSDNRITSVYASLAMFGLVVGLGLASDLRSRDFKLWWALRSKKKAVEKKRNEEEVKKLLEIEEAAGP